MVLGKLSVPGRQTNLDLVEQGPIALAVGAVGLLGLLGHFSFVYLSSFSLSLGDGPTEIEYCLKGPLSPKQLTNQNLFFN